MPDYIVTSEGRRLKKVATRTTTPVSDSAVKKVYVDAPRVCYNMPNEEFFPLMMRLRDKAVRLMGDRLAELARWNAADRDKVLLWFGEDSEVTRQTLSDGLTRMREVMRGLTERNFVTFTPEGVRAVGCVPKAARAGELPAAASVCKPDGTYTIFVDTIFCDAEPERSQIDTGIPINIETKLTILIHEVSHFPPAMNSEDKVGSMRQVAAAAKRRDTSLVGNADSIAYYISNIPNWDYSPPKWRP